MPVQLFIGCEGGASTPNNVPLTWKVRFAQCLIGEHNRWPFVSLDFLVGLVGGDLDGPGGPEVGIHRPSKASLVVWHLAWHMVILGRPALHACRQNFSWRMGHVLDSVKPGSTMPC